MQSVFGNDNGGSTPAGQCRRPRAHCGHRPDRVPRIGGHPESSVMSDQTATIRQVLADHGRLSAAVDSLGDADSLFDAGLSSHAAVNVMLALEDHFDVEFPERFLKRATFESVTSLQGALTEILLP